MKDDERDTPLMFAPARTYVKYEPLGVALIFGSWNYPFVVTLKPLAQAITTGNCAVIKPSEMAPASSAIVKKLVDTYLDTTSYSVIEGGPEVAAKISHYHWDLICFTGSTMKGKLVAEAAGKNLIPCILELGGKCPTIVDATADIDFAAGKVCFARFNNAGQTCIGADYVLVHESVQTQFLDRLTHHLRTMYGSSNPAGPRDMGKVVTDWHCDRLQQLIDTSKGRILTGGKVDRNSKWVEPTIIVNPDRKAPIMDEEIFGPLLPIIVWKDIEEVIETINGKDKPLAIYYFGKTLSNPIKDRLINETSSGAFLVNEAIIHIVNHEFGFGGVGGSGYGRYGGYDGFKQWSNPKSIMVKPPMNFYPYNQLTPPFTPGKIKLVRTLFGLKGTQNKAICYAKLFSAILFVYFTYSCMIQPLLKKTCSYAFSE